MKNLQMFGSGDSWGRFLYKEGTPTYSPGDLVDTKGIVKSPKVEIKDGTGIIRDSECKKEVKAPWDTESQNTLLGALAKEIQKGGNIEAIVAQKGNTLGQIAFAMKKAEKEKPEADRNSFAKIGWGTTVQYFNDKREPQGDEMPLAKANALKPEWKVVFREVEGKTKIDVIMDTATTKDQLDSLRTKVTKIDCDKDKESTGGVTGTTNVVGTGERGVNEVVGGDEVDQSEVLDPQKEADLKTAVAESLEMKRLKIHFDLVNKRKNHLGEKLFSLMDAGGIKVKTTNRTMQGSGIGKKELEVISAEKLKELGIKKETALGILNKMNEQTYKDVVKAIPQVRMSELEMKKEITELEKRAEELKGKGRNRRAEKKLEKIAKIQAKLDKLYAPVEN